MKKILVIAILICLCISLYAENILGSDFNSSSVEEEVYTSADLEDRTQKAQLKEKQKLQKESEEKIKNTFGTWSIFSRGAATVIDNVYISVLRIHNEMFGIVSDSLKTVKESLSLKERLNFKNGSIFSWFLAIFVVLQCLIYAIRIVTANNFQYAEVPAFLIRISIILIIFYFIPFLPSLIINLSFGAAETVTGSPAGSVSLHTAITGLSPFQAGLSVGGLAAYLSSFLYAESNLVIAKIGFMMIPMKTFGIILLSASFAGLILSFLVSLQFLLLCIELFIANIAMSMILPSTVFTGLGDNMKDSLFGKVLRYYFISMVKIFIGAVIVLIGKGIINGNWVQINEGSNQSLLLAYNIFIPLAMAILMFTSNKMLSRFMKKS